METVDLTEGPRDTKSPVKAAKSEPKTYRKPAARSPVKAKSPKKTKEASASSSLAYKGASAEDILESIPDADPSYLKIDPDAASMNFFQLKAKQAQDQPTSHRDIPIAAPNCLNGLTIVFTGVLPSIDRDECARVAGQYGAKVTKSVSGRTSLVVIGRDAGPKKVQTIKQKHIKCIDEEGFILLLEKMPADGGSGEAAQKALSKKHEEEAKAIADAEAEEKVALKQAEASGINRSQQLWTDKYAPTEMRQICGNKKNVEMLYSWLETWFQTDHPGKPFKGAPIENYRAVLISGPPGTGKTTAANLVARKLGYDIIEKNASDVRSKKLLNSELKVCLDNTSVAGYFKVAQRPPGEVKPEVDQSEQDRNDKRFVLIMDEVDGMSSGDNGGVAQLSQFARITKTPMILICNDKSLPKMRLFDRSCYDMTWRRPTAREMKSRLMTIAHREGLKLDPSVVDQLCESTHNDIRQIINIMSQVNLTQKTLGFDSSAAVKKSWEKEVALKPFDVVGRMLSSGSYGDGGRYDINGKLNLYFNDIDLVPLMIHENYRSTQPAGAHTSLDHLKRLSAAAEAISASDLVNQAVRMGEQQWSLLPFHGLMSTIIPGAQVAGRVTGRVMFASWLGQNSKAGKFQRIVQQLQYHSSTKTHTNNQELRLSYVPYLKDMLCQPLVTKQADGIDQVLALMDEYYLTKEDWDNMMDMGVGRGRMDAKLKRITTSVKTQFTRRYNAYSHPTIIYKTGSTTRISKPEKSGYSGDVIDDDKAEEDDSTDDVGDDTDLKKDSLIKAVKKRRVKKKIA